MLTTFWYVGPRHGSGPSLIDMSSASRTKVVLYVEDNAEHRELLRTAAKTCQVKFALAMAHGLYDAIDYLGGQGKYGDRLRYPLPNFALVDYSLGSFKGTELARWIRKHANLSSLPVVMFSAHTEVSQMADCYAAGADYYIRKPHQFHDLLKIVRGLEASIEHDPPRVATLAEMAADPALDSEALKTALSTGLAYEATLREQALARLAKLGLTMAVREQTKSAET
jgi:CheY-like chemotaxis protein